MTLKLLTFVGTNKYIPCIYKLNEIKASVNKFISVALTEILLNKPDIDREVYVFMTEKARSVNWISSDPEKSGLADELDSLCNKPEFKGIRINPIVIPNGFTTEEMWEVFKILKDQIKDGDSLYFDITLSFRSIPVLALLLTNYVRVLQKVKIEGIYYGAFEKLFSISNVNDIPLEQRLVDIVDLTEFINLMDWSVAADKFLTTGNARQLYQLAQEKILPIKKQLRDTNSSFTRLKNQINNIDKFAEQLATTRVKMILDTTAPNLAENSVRKEQQSQAFVEALVPLMQRVETELDQLKVGDDIAQTHFLVKWCWQHDLIQQGWTILRENIITYMCRQVGFSEANINSEMGNDRDLMGQACYVIVHNTPIEKWSEGIKKYPQFIERIKEKAQLTKLAQMMDSIGSFRNDLNHAQYIKGGRHNSSVFRDELKKKIQEFDQVLANAMSDKGEKKTEGVEQPKTGGRRVLISPLGLSPGLLYSAILHIRPNLIIVLCSEQAARGIDEIQSKSGFKGKLFCLKVDDPFLCFNAKEKVIQDIHSILKHHSVAGIIVNLTGGTTALQYLVQNVERDLNNNGYECAEVAFIDRRNPSAQRKNPYVLGEMIQLSDNISFEQ